MGVEPPRRETPWDHAPRPEPEPPPGLSTPKKVAAGAFVAVLYAGGMGFRGDWLPGIVGGILAGDRALHGPQPDRGAPRSGAARERRQSIGQGRRSSNLCRYEVLSQASSEGSGSNGLPPSYQPGAVHISKCRWQPLARPVWPT